MSYAIDPIKHVVQAAKEEAANLIQKPQTAVATSGATIGTGFIPGDAGSLAQLVGAALSLTLIFYYIVRAVADHKKSGLERQKLRIEIEHLRAKNSEDQNGTH